RRHRKDHTFLRFREPDLPWCQALILEGGTFQFNVCSGLCAHFTYRRREATCATIGNGMVKLAITSLDNDITDLLLSNRSTDLYCSASLCINLQAHLTRRERRTMYTITACAPTK